MCLSPAQDASVTNNLMEYFTLNRIGRTIGLCISSQISLITHIFLEHYNKIALLNIPTPYPLIGFVCFEYFFLSTLVDFIHTLRPSHSP